MELFYMVLKKRCFKRITVGSNAAVDILRPVAAESAGTGNFVETVPNISVYAYEDSAKVHCFSLLFWFLKLN